MKKTKPPPKWWIEPFNIAYALLPEDRFKEIHDWASRQHDPRTDNKGNVILPPTDFTNLVKRNRAHDDSGFPVANFAGSPFTSEIENAAALLFWHAYARAIDLRSKQLDADEKLLESSQLPSLALKWEVSAAEVQEMLKAKKQLPTIVYGHKWVKQKSKELGANEHAQARKDFLEHLQSESEKWKDEYRSKNSCKPAVATQKFLEASEKWECHEPLKESWVKKYALGPEFSWTQISADAPGPFKNNLLRRESAFLQHQIITRKKELFEKRRSFRTSRSIKQATPDIDALWENMNAHKPWQEAINTYLQFLQALRKAGLKEPK